MPVLGKQAEVHSTLMGAPVTSSVAKFHAKLEASDTRSLLAFATKALSYVRDHGYLHSSFPQSITSEVLQTLCNTRPSISSAGMDPRALLLALVSEVRHDYRKVAASSDYAISLPSITFDRPPSQDNIDYSTNRFFTKFEDALWPLPSAYRVIPAINTALRARLLASLPEGIAEQLRPLLPRDCSLEKAMELLSFASEEARHDPQQLLAWLDTSSRVASDSAAVAASVSYQTPSFSLSRDDRDRGRSSSRERQHRFPSDRRSDRLLSHGDRRPESRSGHDGGQHGHSEHRNGRHNHRDRSHRRDDRRDRDRSWHRDRSARDRSSSAHGRDRGRDRDRRSTSWSSRSDGSQRSRSSSVSTVVAAVHAARLSTTASPPPAPPTAATSAPAQTSAPVPTPPRRLLQVGFTGTLPSEAPEWPIVGVTATGARPVMYASLAGMVDALIFCDTGAEPNLLKLSMLRRLLERLPKPLSARMQAAFEESQRTRTLPHGRNSLPAAVAGIGSGRMPIVGAVVVPIRLYFSDKGASTAERTIQKRQANVECLVVDGELPHDVDVLCGFSCLKAGRPFSGIAEKVDVLEFYNAEHQPPPPPQASRAFPVVIDDASSLEEAFAAPIVPFAAYVGARLPMVGALSTVTTPFTISLLAPEVSPAPAESPLTAEAQSPLTASTWASVAAQPAPLPSSAASRPAPPRPTAPPFAPPSQWARSPMAEALPPPPKGWRQTPAETDSSGWHQVPNRIGLSPQSSSSATSLHESGARELQERLWSDTDARLQVLRQLCEDDASLLPPSPSNAAINTAPTGVSAVASASISSSSAAPAGDKPQASTMLQQLADNFHTIASTAAFSQMHLLSHVTSSLLNAWPFSSALAVASSQSSSSSKRARKAPSSRGLIRALLMLLAMVGVMDAFSSMQFSPESVESLLNQGYDWLPPQNESTTASYVTTSHSMAPPHAPTTTFWITPDSAPVARAVPDFVVAAASEPAPPQPPIPPAFKSRDELLALRNRNGERVVDSHASFSPEEIADVLLEFNNTRLFSTTPPPLDALKLPQFHVELTDPDVLPREVHRPVPFRHDAAGPCFKTIQGWVDAGLCEWVGPDVPAFGFVFPVTKGGGKWRVTANTVNVNDATRPLFEGAGVMPFDMEDNIRAFAGCSWFFELDMVEGFSRCRIAEDARPLFTFISPWGKLRYNVGCYGPRDLPLHFHKVINEHVVQPSVTGLSGSGPRETDLRDHCTASVWLDDIAGGARDTNTPEGKAAALELLRRVLRRLNAHGCQVNLSKSRLNLSSVAHLGMVTDGKRMWIDPTRIAGLADMPLPTTLKQLQAGLGVFGYYRWAVQPRKFVQLFGKLSQLNRSSFTKEQFTAKHAEAWRALAQEIALTAPLALPDYSRPVYVQVDAANDYGYGVILEQFDDLGRPRPIAFFSGGWKSNELGWSPNTKEAAALHRAICRIVPRFCPGADVRVETDHHNWVGKGMADSPDPLVRKWWQQICCQDFVVYHIPGSLNAADHPSRVAHAEQWETVPQPRFSSDSARPPSPPSLASIPPPLSHAETLVKESPEDPMEPIFGCVFIPEEPTTTDDDDPLLICASLGPDSDAYVNGNRTLPPLFVAVVSQRLTALREAANATSAVFERRSRGRLRSPDVSPSSSPSPSPTPRRRTRSNGLADPDPSDQQTATDALADTAKAARLERAQRKLADHNGAGAYFLPKPLAPEPVEASSSTVTPSPHAPSTPTTTSSSAQDATPALADSDATVTDVAPDRDEGGALAPTVVTGHLRTAPAIVDIARAQRDAPVDESSGWTPDKGFARHSINGTELVTHRGKAYIPMRATALKERMMALGHEVAMHANAFATTRAIADAGITWNGVQRDVESWIHACPECQYARCPRQRRMVGELEPTLPPHAGHTVYADYFMTHTASEESGTKCLCVLIDGLTRWMEIYPYATANGANTIASLNDWADRFGLPVVLRTDNGSHFANNEVDAWCARNNVSFEPGIAYHHQGQGIVERPMRDVIQKLIIDCGVDIQRWAADNRPRRIAAAHNRTPISFLGMSPFKMTFGRDPRTPLNASVGWSPRSLRSIAEFHQSLSAIQEAALLGSAVQRLQNRTDHARRSKRAPVFETSSSYVNARPTSCCQPLKAFTRSSSVSMAISTACTARSSPAIRL